MMGQALLLLSFLTSQCITKHAEVPVIVFTWNVQGTHITSKIVVILPKQTVVAQKSCDPPFPAYLPHKGNVFVLYVTVPVESCTRFSQWTQVHISKIGLHRLRNSYFMHVLSLPQQMPMQPIYFITKHATLNFVLLHPKWANLSIQPLMVIQLLSSTLWSQPS